MMATVWVPQISKISSDYKICPKKKSKLSMILQRHVKTLGMTISMYSFAICFYKLFVFNLVIQFFFISIFFLQLWTGRQTSGLLGFGTQETWHLIGTWIFHRFSIEHKNEFYLILRGNIFRTFWFICVQNLVRCRSIYGKIHLISKNGKRLDKLWKCWKIAEELWNFLSFKIRKKLSIFNFVKKLKKF